MSTITLSIVIPVFNEEENLSALVDRLQRTANTLQDEATEFIFVDDGSRDASFQLLKGLAEKDERVKALRLSRNFGSHHACLAGLSYARGQRLIIMAADLQDPPELIPDLLRAQSRGVDVVWAKREAREERKRILFFATLYHRFMQRFVFRDWPGEGADVVLLTKRVRGAILAWPEKNTSIFGQIFWLGFPSASISYVKGKRNAGRSKWNFSKRLKLGLDSVVSFSFFPIRLISYVGILISVTGFLYALLILFLRITHITQVPGWASLMIVFLLISGIQLLMLGVIGEYLWRSADQVKTRPFYVLTEQVGFDELKPASLPTHFNDVV